MEPPEQREPLDTVRRVALVVVAVAVRIQEQVALVVQAVLVAVLAEAVVVEPM